MTASTGRAVLTALELRNLTPLVDDVCLRRSVVREELCGRARTSSVSRARQELWWMIRNQPGLHYSLLEIASLFGRNHTTVLHGIQAHQRRAVSGQQPAMRVHGGVGVRSQ